MRLRLFSPRGSRQVKLFVSPRPGQVPGRLLSPGAADVRALDQQDGADYDDDARVEDRPERPHVRVVGLEGQVTEYIQKLRRGTHENPPRRR